MEAVGARVVVASCSMAVVVDSASYSSFLPAREAGMAAATFPCSSSYLELG